MDYNLEYLLDIQKNVNDIILKKAKWKPDKDDFLLAMFVEVFEFINTIPHWKWWKHSQEINFDRTLDEMADIMAFYLSYLLAEDPLEFEQDCKVLPYIIEYYELNQARDTEALVKKTFKEMIEGEDDPTALFVKTLFITKFATGASNEDIIKAYLKKSEENIERQRKNY